MRVSNVSACQVAQCGSARAQHSIASLCALADGRRESGGEKTRQGKTRHPGNSWSRPATSGGERALRCVAFVGLGDGLFVQEKKVMGRWA